MTGNMNPCEEGAKKLSMNDSWTVWALSKVFPFTEDIIEESFKSIQKETLFLEGPNSRCRYPMSII
ncbi:hypothetical protein ACIQWQ_21055 [Peribacillus frigoritolerans]